MGSRAKIVEYCNDRFKGSLTEESCRNLETLIELDKRNGCVSDLRHIIYNITESDVYDIINDIETFGDYMREYEKPRGTLRDEQTIGVAFLYNAEYCILGDSVGMGKTVEIAGLLNLLKTQANNNGRNFRYLFLTEKNIADQARKELIKFTGDYNIFIQSGEIKYIDKFVNDYPYNEDLPYSVVGTHALFTTAGFLGWLEQSRQYGNGFPFDILIVDESSPLGGKSSNKIVNGYKSISKYFKRIIFLNATPFETKLEIFFNQLNLLDKKMMPTKTNFKKQYCKMDYRGMYPKPTGKYKNQAEFKRLIAYRYFARTRRDKGAEMIDCEGGIVYSPLSSIQKEWLNKTTLYRVVYDCPNHLDSSIEFNSENVPKLASLHSLIQNEGIDSDSILIFVYYKEAQKALSNWLTKRGYSNRTLNGDTDDKERASVIKGFKNKEYRILITNVQKGLNFGDCDFCIFYSFDPNPSKMIQFEGRTTRDFNIIGKNVYILCSKGKEERKLKEIVKQRARATADMTNVDLSVVMNILLEGTKEEE